MAGPSKSTVQSEPSNMSFILLNTMHPHNDYRGTIIEIMQHKASLFGRNAKMGERPTKWPSL